MEKITHEVGESLTVRIELIGGDLRVSGRDEPRIEVQAPEKGRLEVERDGDEITIKCRSGCLVFMPGYGDLDVVQVGGDARITGVENDIFLRTVGGDLSLTRVGNASFELVGGDIRARKITGNLTVDRIGGDAALERVTGDVILRSVGGDIYLTKHQGSASLKAGGDVVISFLPLGSSESEIHAGGDLSCTLRRGASISAQYKCGGDLHLPARSPSDKQADDRTYVMGDGEATLKLKAGGDLWIRKEDQSGDDFGALNGLDVISEIDSKIAEMEAQFDALGAGLHGFDAKRIGEKVRHSVAKAQRKAARAEKMRVRLESEFFDRGESLAATEEERLTILKMVEDGKVSVDEAEMLLNALEGNA